MMLTIEIVVPFDPKVCDRGISEQMHLEFFWFPGGIDHQTLVLLLKSLHELCLGTKHTAVVRSNEAVRNVSSPGGRILPGTGFHPRLTDAKNHLRERRKLRLGGESHDGGSQEYKYNAYQLTHVVTSQNELHK